MIWTRSEVSEIPGLLASKYSEPRGTFTLCSQTSHGVEIAGLRRVRGPSFQVGLRGK